MQRKEYKKGAAFSGLAINCRIGALHYLKGLQKQTRGANSESRVPPLNGLALVANWLQPKHFGRVLEKWFHTQHSPQGCLGLHSAPASQLPSVPAVCPHRLRKAPYGQGAQWGRGFAPVRATGPASGWSLLTAGSRGTGESWPLLFWFCAGQLTWTSPASSTLLLPVNLICQF